MILFEKYNKSMINKKIYDTVMLADVVDLKNEKYFILYGYLFNSQESNQEIKLDKEYINDTFFKRDINDKDSDIDAYYLIYNIDKKQIVKNKKKFIQDNMLEKNIRLDNTKCEKITIGDIIAYKLNTKHAEYVFVELETNNYSYFIMKDTKHGLYPEYVIKFNENNNKAEISNDVKLMQNMVKNIEKKDVLKSSNDLIKFFKAMSTEINNEKDYD